MLTEEAIAKELTFLNRDHIISVVIDDTRIIVTTTDAEKITFRASTSTVAKFSDDLANDVQSNFVSIAAEPRAVTTKE